MAGARLADKTGTNRVPMISARRPRLPALALLVAGLLLAALAGWLRHTHNAGVREARFDTLANSALRQIESRMRGYEFGLRGARGAAIAAGGRAITRERFHAYSVSRDAEAEFPGSRGFGLVWRVAAAREDEFVAAARAEGVPDFRVIQLTPHEGERFVIQYIEPVENNVEAVGLDIASEPKRRAAALVAMRSDQPALTAPLTLVQARGRPLRSFLILLALRPTNAYFNEAEAEAQTIGWAYMPLVIDEVLQGLDDHDRGGEFDFALSDAPLGGQPERFYATPGWQATGAAGLSRQLDLPLFGRMWQVDVQARAPFLARLNLRDPRVDAALIAAASVLLAVLLHLYLLGLESDRRARTQRARMAAMVESAQDAVIGLTLQGVVTDWNGAAERIFGYTAAEALGRKVADLIVPPDGRAEEEDRRRRLAAGETVPRFDAVRQARDGSRIDASVSLALIRAGEDAAITGIAKTVHDISARKAAEARVLELNATLEQQVNERTARLRELVARERGLLTSAPTAVIATDTEGRITLFNPAAEAMLGYKAQQVIGTHVQRLHEAGEMRARIDAMALRLGRPLALGDFLADKLRAREPERGEWSYVRSDGQRVPVLLSTSVLRDDAGQPLGFIGVAIDLTERKRLEAELRALNQALQERSVQAEAANRAKSSFLANMSHEIRTPMNAVIGITYLLEQTALDERQRGLVDKIGLSSQALLAVINDVLDLSKIEAGEMPLDDTVFDLRRTVDGVTGVLSLQAERKGIDLATQMAGDVPAWLRGDPIRIAQALTNLVSNAIKFTDRGGVVVDVQCLRRTPRLATLRLSVIDTGIGIAPELQANVFTPFTQVDSSATRRFGGTGLGLSIVKRLVDLMDGDVGLRSTPGEGSEFWITLTLPLAAAPAVALPQPESADADAARGRRLEGVRVLLVDDSAINLDVGRAVLGSEGAQVHVATDGAEAVQMLRAEPGAFDLVLMDVQMPGMDGHEATRRIRREPALAGLPVIALTAGALSSERERAIEAGMNDFITKPFDAEAMIESVRAHAEAGRRTARA